jgi:hypothetical protein
VNEGLVKVRRNDPCPCGSGKKYKKCCLPKGEAFAQETAPGSAAAQAAEDEVEDEWEEAEPPEEADVRTADGLADAAPWPPAREYPRLDENLPTLPADQQRIVEDWWQQAAQLYRKRDADQMLKRVESALEELPGLFVHLGLHQEFMFELKNWPSLVAAADGLRRGASSPNRWRHRGGRAVTFFTGRT